LIFLPFSKLLLSVNFCNHKSQNTFSELISEWHPIKELFQIAFNGQDGLKAKSITSFYINSYIVHF
jgi:hypothetical protein